MDTEVDASPRQAPPQKRQRNLADDQSRVAFVAVAFLIGLLLRYWVRLYKAVGVENVPREGGVFVIANHTSGLDPFLLGYPLRHRMPAGPGKVELFANPAIAFVMLKLGIFPLRQRAADPSGVRAMVELYRAGRLVIVYPEGGRSPSGEVQEFMPEFARLMIRLRAVMLPTGVAGANEALPIGSLIPRRNTPLVVVFGKPFELSAYYDRKLTSEDLLEASTFLKDQVSTLVDIAREEAARLRVSG
jgi:1-acyl-sn-glycerol-3-phosphate acyltransferase